MESANRSGRMQRQAELKRDLQIGFRNVHLVVGRRYKKYMVYAIFDYICEIKEELYLLGEAFLGQIDVKLKELIEEARSTVDRDFYDVCMCYQSQLRDYISLGSSRDFEV